MKRILAVLGMVLLSSLGAVAQNRLITGIVADAENKGIIAASIEVQGKPFSAITDAEGRFKMNVPEGKVTLNVSSMGFGSKQVVLQENENRVSVILIENTQELKDVVVTSFGVKKQKKSLGYAV
ncbi:MAG: carboxypeptidase-like regulatory domain-containing protein, partial [Flavobacterium sp.]